MVARLTWVWSVLPLVMTAGVWLLNSSLEDRNRHADDLRVEVVQHIEANRYTLLQPLTSQDRGDIEVNEYGMAVVQVTGRPGELVRITIEQGKALTNHGSDGSTGRLHYRLQAAWVEGSHDFGRASWGRAQQITNMNEFTVRLSRDRRAGWTQQPVLHHEHAGSERRNYTRGTDRILKEVRKQPRVRRTTGAGRERPQTGTATIYIKPVLKPDGQQPPGRFLADLTVRADAEDDKNDLMDPLKQF